jgi:hypothetical protein
MDKYLEADIALAEALGYTDVTQSQFYYHSIRGKKNGEGTLIQRATLDDAEAFRLMVEYCVFPESHIGLIFVRDIEGSTEEEAKYWCDVFSMSNHPDKLTAVRFAIVQAVIAKLKAKK